MAPADNGSSPRRFEKTCHLCGRTGSHAFRRTPDGTYECTTLTACRARQRRQSGARHEGRGRLARARAAIPAVGPPGIVYVVGPPGEERDEVRATLQELTRLTVLVRAPSRRVLAAFATWNVKLIAIDAACLVGVGFRNELALRHRQPRLHSVPIVVYGDPGNAERAVAFDEGVRPFQVDSLPAV
jgi:PleD family two-component response regulator